MLPQHTSRRRETFLVLFLLTASALAITMFAFLVTGRYFLAILSVVAGMIILGLLQYVLWGRPMQRGRGMGPHSTLFPPR